MTHLLDTDVIINHLKGKKEILPSNANDYVMSVVTLGELLYGAEKSTNQQRVHESISRFRSEFHVSTIEVTEEIIRQFAKLKTVLSKTGKLIEDFDLLIAATAIEHHLTLVTGNKKHFTRIPSLKLL